MSMPYVPEVNIYLLHEPFLKVFLVDRIGVHFDVSASDAMQVMTSKEFDFNFYSARNKEEKLLTLLDSMMTCSTRKSKNFIAYILQKI